jgi:hypothetical protein
MRVPFGKYKGQDSKELLDDQSYYNWCKLNQELTSKYAKFFQSLENPDKPENNNKNIYKLTLGAIDKVTGYYVLPCNADKKNKYICPDCSKDLIFKKGEVKAPHFAHYSEKEPCNYYNHPSESQIHKDAKLLLKSLLEKRKNIIIEKQCYDGCNLTEYPIEYTETSKAELEHRFDFNNSKKSADVALLSMDKIKYIFEICHKHKTSPENRPEPWFEFDATELVNNANTNFKQDIIRIPCIRKNYLCGNHKKVIDYFGNSEIGNLSENSENSESIKTEEQYSYKCHNDNCYNHLTINDYTDWYYCITCKPNFLCINYKLCRSTRVQYLERCFSCNSDKSTYIFLENSNPCQKCGKLDDTKLLYPSYCGHYFCMDCSRERLFQDDNKSRICPIKYGCPPCIHFKKENKSCISRPCCEHDDIIIENFEKSYPHNYNKWEMAEEKSLENYNKTFNNRCPLCKKSISTLKDVIQSFNNSINGTCGTDNLEEIQKQLLNYKTLTVYNELNNRINDKIELFKSEIKKYEALLITNMDNDGGLQNMLKELSDKKYLIDVKYKIMSRIQHLQNENDTKVIKKLNEFYHKIDSQRERLDKLYNLKELFDKHASIIDSDSPKLTVFISKTRSKLLFAIDRFESKFIVIKEETYLLDNNNNIYDVSTNKYLGKYFNNKLLPITSA